MIKYKTGYRIAIEKVECTRETEHCVFYMVRGKERKAFKEGYEHYFDTFDQAKAYLVDKAQKKVEMAKNHYQYAQSELVTAESLREDGV